MGIPNFIKGDIIKAALRNVAGNNDTKATILGFVASAVLAAQIDYGKLLQKDPNEIGKAVGVLVAAVFGYYTNKKDKAPVINVPNPHHTDPDTMESPKGE